MDRLPWPLDSKLDSATNRDVIAYLRRVQPSAHSDIASVLTDAMHGLPGAYWYCPDKHAYAYVAACTPQHGIFGLAYGMSGLALRLDRSDHPRAIADGARGLPEIGDEWLGVPDTGNFGLARWCQLAYTHVSRLAEGPPRPAHSHRRQR